MAANLAQWKAALSRPTNLVLLETPSNPMLELVDLPAVAEMAHAAGAIVVVDNVFATPLLQQPLKLGADVVVYSCTKHMDGQGRVLGGAVLGSKKWINEVLQPFIRNTGPALSPFNAWILLKGIETLALRVDAAGRSAAADRRLPGRAERRHPRMVSDARRSSAAGFGSAANDRRRNRRHVRGRGREGGRVPGHERLPTDRPVEQSG